MAPHSDPEWGWLAPYHPA